MSEIAETVTLPREQWQTLERAHAEHADALTAGWRERRGRGEKHPVDDFLFTYYPYKPSALRRWHPGLGVRLADAAAEERAGWPGYRVEGSAVTVDPGAVLERRADGIRSILRLLEATRGRPANHGCFGLHEWAMVYRQDEHRHGIPLRLGQGGTDDVVERHKIACSHIDAFRFFSPDAVPLNRLRPTRENQPQLEQPGCLHAGMDLYKWASKLGPLLPGEILLDSFELARDIRRLDMEASPYDLRAWGYTPVAIETPDGKAEYVARQRAFAERGNALRDRILVALAPLGELSVNGEGTVRETGLSRSSALSMRDSARA